MNTDETLAVIERKIGDAARELNPLLASSTPLVAHVVAERVHDALNALAAAQLRLGLLQQEIDSKGAGS
jgi:hypothetical protein